MRLINILTMPYLLRNLMLFGSSSVIEVKLTFNCFKENFYLSTVFKFTVTKKVQDILVLKLKHPLFCYK